MIIGVFLYSFTIGSLTNLLSNLDSRKAALGRKLEILQALAKEYKFNKSFYQKLSKALEYEYNQGRRDYDEIINDIPDSLRTQLLIIIYKKMVESNNFFENKQPSFVAYVAPLLKPLRVEKSEFIYKKGEYASEMYFLVKGEVAIVVEQEHMAHPFIVINEGYYFGEVDLLFSETRKYLYTTKAMKRCELLTLSRENFEIMCKRFEEDVIDILARAKERQERTQIKYEQAQQDLQNSFKVQRHVSMPESTDMMRRKSIVDLQRVSMLRQLASIAEMEDESESYTEKNSFDNSNQPDTSNLLGSTQLNLTQKLPPIHFKSVQTLNVDSMTDDDQQPLDKRKTLSDLSQAHTLFNQLVDNKIGAIDQVATLGRNVRWIEQAMHNITDICIRVCKELDIEAEEFLHIPAQLQYKIFVLQKFGLKNRFQQTTQLPPPLKNQVPKRISSTLPI